MRHSRRGWLVLGVLAVSTGSLSGQAPAAPPQAQPELVAPPSWLYNDLACAPSLTTAAPPATRVLGSQDTVIKRSLGPGDTLVVSGGSGAGLQPGQQYFVRRHVIGYGARTPDKDHPIGVHTAGWVQINGVDANIATATFIHACDGVLLDDYLEPFSAPMIAAHAAQGTAPQYANMGHIGTGDLGVQSVGAGQMVTIDRGTNQGVVMGQRYLVFRDKREMRNDAADYSMTFAKNVRNIPLVEIGEILIVATRPDDATAQVVVSKDAITTGDLIAEVR